jgi:hypothetical protein
MVELGLFQSRVNPDLRTQYLPLEIAAAWEIFSADTLTST